MAQSAEPTQILSAQALAGMSPAERAAYFGSLPPDIQDSEQAAFKQYVSSANAQFMALAIKKTAPMVPQGGGITAQYSAGAAITWDFPTTGGAWASAIIVTCVLTVNNAVGTGAAYALNQLAPLTVFDRVQVLLNGVQHNFRPYILKYIAGILRGYVKSPEPSVVMGGNSDATIQGQLNGTPYGVATGNNTWTFKFRIPLNALNESNPAGMLPMQSAGTKPQLVITCAPNPLGNDPILNAVRTTAGTGAATTITGTIQCDVQYRDGTNLFSSTALGLDLTDVPTVQYVNEQQISNLVQGNINRGRITTLLQHYVVLDAIVDATTAGQLVQGLNNIQVAELDMDSVGQNSFYKYGSASGTNVSLFDFYEQFRHQYGQDLDEGIIPWVVGWGNHTNNPDARDGSALLNMMVGGWPDVNRAYQLGTIGAIAGMAPRVDTHLLSLNPAGLKLVQI